MSQSAAHMQAVKQEVIAAVAKPEMQRRPQSLSTTDSGPAVPRFASSLSAIPATPEAPTVQRKCAACEATEKEEESTVQPRLEVGPVGDYYEREADTIAAQTLATPAQMPAAANDNSGSARRCAACEAEEKVRPLRPTGDGAGVLRRCAACEAAEKEKVRAKRVSEPAGAAARPVGGIPPPIAANDNSGMLRRCAACEAAEKDKVRTSPAPGGATQLGASPGQLTTGGSPLAAGTRDFFESRMSRDLSSVRVHDGSESERLNGSIAARAFTYSDHIWLGRGERADTGFTMAHELAHVLQQTQPGTARPRRRPVAASASQPVVQRSNLRTFWLPAGYKESALDLHSSVHDQAADAMAKNNPGRNFIREAPIPGASAKTVRVGGHGFADLYEGTTTIGVQQTVASQKAGSNRLPVWHFSPHFHKMPTRGPGLQGFNHEKERAPRVNSNGVISALDRAPRKIRIADMKPGHNLGAREAGVQQIDNYALGIQRVVDATNTMLPAGTPAWTCDVAAIARGQLNRPTTFKPKGFGKGADIPLKLTKNSMGVALDKVRGQKKDYKTGILGDWVIAEDNKHDGIWTYLLVPQQASLNKIVAKKTTEARFVQVQHKLQVQVIKPLTKKIQTRPLAAPAQRPAASPAVRRIQRAPKRRAKPRDDFNYAKWNAGRTGQSDKDVNGFAGYYHDKLDQERAGVEERADILDSLKLMETNFKGVTRSMPASQQVEDFARQLKLFDFWASRAGGIIGRLRQMFGGLFVKVIELGGKIKEKLKGVFAKFSFKTSGGGLKAVARKVGAVLVKYIGKIVLQRSMWAIMDCLAVGITRKMTKLVEGTPIEELEQKVVDIEAFAERTKDELVKDVEGVATQIIGNIGADYDELARDAVIIGEIVGGIKTALNLLRLASCLAGGVETLGISCILALGDFVLSLFGISPIDMLAGRIMQSCEAKQAVAKVMIATKFFRDLPKRIAKYVIDHMKPLLPDWLQDLFCDTDKDMGIEQITDEDVECGEGAESDSEDGMGGQGSGGEGGTGTAAGGEAERSGPGTDKQGGGLVEGGSGGGSPTGGPAGGDKGEGGGEAGDKGNKGTKSGSGGKTASNQSSTKKDDAATGTAKGNVKVESGTAERVDPDTAGSTSKDWRVLITKGLPSESAVKSAAASGGLTSTVTATFWIYGKNEKRVQVVVDAVFKGIKKVGRDGVVTYDMDFAYPFRIPELDLLIKPGNVTIPYRGIPQ